MSGQDLVGVTTHKVKMHFSTFTFWKRFTSWIQTCALCIIPLHLLIFGAHLLTNTLPLQPALVLTGTSECCTGDCPPEEEEEGWGWGTICGISGLAWAGRLWEGWAVGAAGGSLGAADGSGRLREAPPWTSPTTTLPWVRDVLFPKLSYVGHNRTSVNISNRFNSCGFFSASPLLFGLRCVSFFQEAAIPFSFRGEPKAPPGCEAAARGSLAEAGARNSLVTIRRRCPSVPPPWDPLCLRGRHVAAWGDINCC